MKKLISVCILLSVLFVLLTGCQSRGPEQDLGDTYVPESDNQYYFYLSGIQGYPMAESEDAYYFLQDQYLYSRNKKPESASPCAISPTVPTMSNSKTRMEVPIATLSLGLYGILHITKKSYTSCL